VIWPGSQNPLAGIKGVAHGWPFRGEERCPQFKTASGLPVDRLYLPQADAIERYGRELGFPGSFPFTRGVQPTTRWARREGSHACGFCDQPPSVGESVGRARRAVLPPEPSHGNFERDQQDNDDLKHFGAIAA
jgi:hypothetical protein